MQKELQKPAFKGKVHQWAQKLGVKVVCLGIRLMNQKWASYSTNGHLNFNSDILTQDQELWDYVIIFNCNARWGNRPSLTPTEQSIIVGAH